MIPDYPKGEDGSLEVAHGLLNPHSTRDISTLSTQK